MPKITEMYAFIAEDKGSNDEGIVGMSLGEWMMPLVGADMERVNSLKPHVLDIAKKTGKRIILVHFTNREELEVIQVLKGSKSS